MYFSKNSRYVLWRAKCMSQSFCFLDCLRGNPKNFCVKSPEDDPTKPPLRINIPNESEKEKHERTSSEVRDSAKVQKKDVVHPRSKSLLSKPSNKHSIKKAYNDDYVNLSKSESDKQITNYDFETNATDSIQHNISFFDEDQYKQQKLEYTTSKEIEKEENSGSVFANKVAQDHATVQNLTVADVKKENLGSSKVKLQGNPQSDSDEKYNEQKALYIIINVPDSQSLQHSNNLTVETSAQLTVDSDALISTTDDTSMSKVPKSDSNSHAKNLNIKSKNQSKSSQQKAAKSKSEPKIKFQVHEIDEAATYVFQLKFKDFPGKTFAVGCVPEKELNMRIENLSDDEGHVRSLSSSASSKTYKGLGKDITLVEDRMESVKYDTVSSGNKALRKNTSDYNKKTFKPLKSHNSSSSDILKSKRDLKKEIIKKSDSEKVVTKTNLEPSRGEVEKLATGSVEVKSNSQSVTPESQPTSGAVAPELDAQAAVENHKVNVDPATTGHSAPKVENTLIQDVTVSETYTQQYSSDHNQYQAEESNYAEQYYSEYYQQEPTHNTKQQEPYDPDAKEYYYYHVDRNVPPQTASADNQIPEIDHPSESAQKPVKNIIDYQKPQGKRKKTDKGGKSDGNWGKNAKFSSSDGASYKRDPPRESVNFHSSADVVKISSDSSPYSMKFCAAYPPTLNEMMIRRSREFGIRRREGYFNPDSSNFSFKDFEKKKSKNEDIDELSENSILFPKGGNSDFKCSSLFIGKKTDVLSVLKTDDNSSKISDNIMTVANRRLTEKKSQPSINSLTMMKKVKEIVDFDLNNAVKIFQEQDASANIEVTSVIVSKENGWVVDEEALQRCISSQKTQLSKKIDEVSNFVDGIKGKVLNIEKIDRDTETPKILPGRRRVPSMKLETDSINSVVTFDPNYGIFQIEESDLENAIYKSNENFENLYHASVTPKIKSMLKAQSSEVLYSADFSPFKKIMNPLETKGGDSILVFDELTQTWKVDYSILEKRQEQIRQEEELTKRSELILETIEKLEKGNVSNIPKPDSREKKIFDYTSEEWRAYKPDESSMSSSKKATKTKLPFKESDAEEIRKKNSDLYENLFLVKKKETKITKEGKEAPGFNSSNEEKKTAGKHIIMAKDVNTGKTDISPLGTGIQPKNTDKSIQKEKEEKVEISKKEDDNFWENFLKTNILPFDRPEQPRPIKPPSPVVPPPSSIIEKTPDIAKIKVPPPKQPHKIDEPKGKIPFPLNRNKIDPADVKIPSVSENPNPAIINQKIPPSKPEPTPPKTEVKIDNPALSNPIPAPNTQKESPSAEVPKKESPAIKLPPSPSKETPPPAKGILDKKIFPFSEKFKQKPIIKQIIGERKIPSALPNLIIKTPLIDNKNQKIQSPENNVKKEIQKEQKSIPADIKKINPPIAKNPESTEKPPPVPPSGSSDPPKPNTPPPSTFPQSKIGPPQVPPAATTRSKLNDPSSTGPPTDFPSKTPSTSKDQPSPPSDPKIDPPRKTPPTIGAPKGDKPTIKVLNEPVKSDKSDLKTKGSFSNIEKKDKVPVDHYISDNIVQMSKNSAKELNSKTKSNTIKTVKVNITPDKRVPSKITEINLNKKSEDIAKERAKGPKGSEKKKFIEKTYKERESSTDIKFYKNFEKYKTPFSDPEYEEKYTKINSDLESNPNLKKLDNWNKTLVLHDVVKPPENIENWLKDETDKMATLLLKVLQEAAEGKPRKKSSVKAKPHDRTSSKGNPYDSIRKKQETSPESFLFKIRSVNLALESDKKCKKVPEILNPTDSKIQKPNEKEIPVQSAKTVKPSKIVDALKVSCDKEVILATPSSSRLDSQSRALFADVKPKLTELVDSHATYSDLSQGKIVTDLTDDIPGPEILKKISSTWKMFPVLGCQLTIFSLLRVFQLVNLGGSFFTSAHPDKSRRHAFNKLFARYGPIVNLQGPLSGNVILIHKPEHLLAVFEQDLSSQVRSVFDSLDQSRREVDEKTLLTGTITDWSKPEWNTLKKISANPMVKGCDKFFEPVEIAGDCLVNNIRRNRNGQNFTSENFMDEIKKWSLEGLCNVFFSRSLGFLESKSSSVNWLLEPDKLFLAVEDASECLSKCERGFQFWRLMITPSLLGLGQAYRTLSGILAKQLYQAELSLRNRNEQIKEGCSINPIDLTYIESMLLFDGQTPEEITCNLVDTLLVGTNAMSASLGFLLYRLAQNVKVQQRLFKEVKLVLPEKGSRLDYQKLQSLKYLQACLKESMRLNTPFPLFFRLLQNDILLSNYVVPKGTYVVMDSRVSCMKEQVFEEPDKFIPGRWLNEDKWMQNSHPFPSFPLCHGPRSDLAKRIVEMQLCSCVAKIVRNFEIEYHFGEVLGTEDIFSFPDKPLKFNFIERSD